MKRYFLISLIVSLSLLAACRSSRDPGSSDTGFLGPSDQTQEAIDLVNEANVELKKIKVIFRENESQKVELKEAMEQKDIERVKKIADDLLYQINDGMALGDDAIGKIEKAQDLNINPTFKEYLRLKEDTLRKQSAAFEYRRKAAKLLRDGFGGTDKKEIENAKNEWKDLEENFQKYMEVAREQSADANKLFKKVYQEQNN